MILFIFFAILICMAKLTIRLLDILIFTGVLFAGILLTIKNVSKKGSVVEVNANGTKYEYSAKKDGLYAVRGELGLTTFEIKDGKVRITDSPCPNKTCINQGWHSPLVCLPNNVIITLKDEDEGGFDGISE